MHANCRKPMLEFPHTWMQFTICDLRRTNGNASQWNKIGIRSTPCHVMSIRMDLLFECIRKINEINRFRYSLSRKLKHNSNHTQIKINFNASFHAWIYRIERRYSLCLHSVEFYGAVWLLYEFRCRATHHHLWDGVHKRVNFIYFN